MLRRIGKTFVVNDISVASIIFFSQCRVQLQNSCLCFEQTKENNKSWIQLEYLPRFAKIFEEKKLSHDQLAIKYMGFVYFVAVRHG